MVFCLSNARRGGGFTTCFVISSLKVLNPVVAIADTACEKGGDGHALVFAVAAAAAEAGAEAGGRGGGGGGGGGRGGGRGGGGGGGGGGTADSALSNKNQALSKMAAMVLLEWSMQRAMVLRLRRRREGGRMMSVVAEEEEEGKGKGMEGGREKGVVQMLVDGTDDGQFWEVMRYLDTMSE
ncbi:Hypothetical protein NocV09_00203390 [Nannochloropsis oceanica]